MFVFFLFLITSVNTQCFFLANLWNNIECQGTNMGCVYARQVPGPLYYVSALNSLNCLSWEIFKLINYSSCFALGNPYVKCIVYLNYFKTFYYNTITYQVHNTVVLGIQNSNINPTTRLGFLSPMFPDTPTSPKPTQICFILLVKTKKQMELSSNRSRKVNLW